MSKILEGLKEAVRYAKGEHIAVDPGKLGGDMTCKTTYAVKNGQVKVVKIEYEQPR